MQRPERVDWLFQRLDAARIHSDSNCHATVFSDTLIAYNRRELQSAEAKSIKVMFLIELVQQFTSLIVRSGIFYKAVVTEGNFSYTKLRKIQAYYGDALLGARAFGSLQPNALRVHTLPENIPCESQGFCINFSLRNFRILLSEVLITTPFGQIIWAPYSSGLSERLKGRSGFYFACLERIFC